MILLCNHEANDGFFFNGQSHEIKFDMLKKKKKKHWPTDLPNVHTLTLLPNQK